MTTMKLWRCPKCKEEVKALAESVGHRCPSNKSVFTQWESIENDK